MAHRKLEELVGGIDFGEGPRWRDDRLWYSDFFQRAVYTVDLDGKRETILELDDSPSGLGWLPNGDLLVVSMHRRQVLRYDGTQTVVHADLSELAPGRCNDMVVSAEGHAWVGNFGRAPDGGGLLEPTRLIHVAPDGAARPVGPPLGFPNGTVITPDGGTLIVGESIGRRISAFSIAADGALDAHRVFAETPGRAPDGACLDAEGGFWFADAAQPGCAVVRVADGGEELDVIEAPQPTFACALGGPERKHLFVLTAPSSNEEKVAGKGEGVLFVTEVAVPGAGIP